MKEILFVSIAFPPKNDPECLQSAKYFRHLTGDKRLSFTVVTSRSPTLFMPVDPNLEKYNRNYQQKIELPVYESKVTNFALRKLVPGGIDYPDSKFSFHLQKARVIRSLRKAPDLIYSRSNPLSSTLLAYKLQRHYNVPWVMHLSDPWVDSPVYNFTPRQRAFHRCWEEKCVHAASAICLTSIHALNFYKEKYAGAAHKFNYFPNVYEKDAESFTPLEFSERLKIVYTGGLLGSRSAQTLVKACVEFVSEHPSFANTFEIIFAGPMDEVNKKVFAANEMDTIKHIGEVSYAQALQLTREAHILLSIDFVLTDPRKAMFFPSKLLDYFLAKRKILALTSAGSATAHALNNVNAVVLRHNDLAAIKDFLHTALNAFLKKDSDYFLADAIPEVYSAEYNAKRLGDLFLEL